MFETVLSCPDGDSKREEGVRPVLVRDAFEVAREVVGRNVGFPRFPVALPFGPIHCCISNLFPRSVAKIFVTIQFCTVASRHFWSPGSGNVDEKEDRKSVSESAYRLNNCLALVGRDAISAIIFFGPGTCTVISGPAW